MKSSFSDRIIKRNQHAANLNYSIICIGNRIGIVGPGIVPVGIVGIRKFRSNNYIVQSATVKLTVIASDQQ